MTMAAMGQGQAAGNSGEGGNANGAQGEAGQNGGGPDLTQLAEALGQQGQSLEEMRSFLQSNPWAAQEPQQEGGEQPSTLDLSWLDNPMMDPEAQQAQIQQSVQALVDQRAQALVAPIQNDLRDLRQNQQVRDLIREYPEMATEEVAAKIAGPGGLASQMAQELAHQLGQPNLASALATQPIVWKWAYMANKAAELANAEQQGSGDPGAATLESGNGAGPGLTGDDLVKGIMQAGGKGGSVLDRM